MRIALCVVLVLAAACSKKSTAEGPVASCLSDGMHGCREYNANNLAAGSDNLAKLCTIVDKAAKFTMTACPTANVIGSCAKPEGKDVYYKGYELGPADVLEKDCTTGGGTWSK